MKTPTRKELARLRRAYQATLYRSDLGEGPFDIRVGQVCWPVARYLKANWRTRRTAAFITACNPLSQMTDEAVNARQMQKLRSRLVADGRLFFPGEGVDPTGKWPGEQSLLVLGITESRCEKLMRQFGQIAYVFLESDCVAQLRFTCLNPDLFLVRRRQLLMAGANRAQTRQDLFGMKGMDKASLATWERARAWCQAWDDLMVKLCTVARVSSVQHCPPQLRQTMRAYVRLWLMAPPEREDWDSTGVEQIHSSPEAAAYDWFGRLSPDICETLGVELVEGEHPGSSYEAAELMTTIASANNAARRLGLDARFERAGREARVSQGSQVRAALRSAARDEATEIMSAISRLAANLTARVDGPMKDSPSPVSRLIEATDGRPGGQHRRRSS